MSLLLSGESLTKDNYEKYIEELKKHHFERLVEELPRFDNLFKGEPVTTLYEGSKGQEYIIKKIYPDGSLEFYEGEKDKEHKVKFVDKNGVIVFYKGDKDQESIIRIENKKNNDTMYYGGDKNQEHKLLWIDKNKSKTYFNGLKGLEYITEIKYQNGIHKYFETKEATIKKINLSKIHNFVDSLTWFLIDFNSISKNTKFSLLNKESNYKNIECLRKIQFPNGKIEIYNGYKDKEYLTCVTYPSGKYEFYIGDKGLESIYQIYSNKTIYKYRGSKGNERLVSKILENGTIEIYKGSKDQEFKVRTKFPNKEIHYFLRYKDEEILTKIIYPDGQEKIFNSKSRDIKKDSKSNITNLHFGYIPPEIPKYSPEVKQELDRKRQEKRNGVYTDQDKVNSTNSNCITQGHKKKLSPTEKYSSDDQYKRKSLFLIQKEENVEGCSCPSCSSVITRVNKNNHLKCIDCKTQFCFLCKTILINHLEKVTRKPHFGLCSKCPQHGNIVNVDN